MVTTWLVDISAVVMTTEPHLNVYFGLITGWNSPVMLNQRLWMFMLLTLNPFPSFVCMVEGTL